MVSLYSLKRRSRGRIGFPLFSGERDVRVRIRGIKILLSTASEHYSSNYLTLLLRATLYDSWKVERKEKSLNFLQ